MLDERLLVEIEASGPEAIWQYVQGKEDEWYRQKFGS